jgi:ketosteroid isomerase-like protein
LAKHVDLPKGGRTVTGEQQEQRAKQLLRAADSGDAATVEAMISDDFTLELMQRVPIQLPTGEPLPTVFDKEGYLDFVRNVASTTKDGMHLTYELAVSDGPYVALFGESNATALSGKKYANVYCWLFRFADDKITLVREYCDTHLVRTVLFG